MEYSRKSILQSFVRSYLQSVLTWSHNLASHEQIENKIAEQVKNNIYVDNLITGDSNGMEVYNTAEELFRQASMNLREWAMNSTELWVYLQRMMLIQKP